MTSLYSRKLVDEQACVENITDHQTWDSRHVLLNCHFNLRRYKRQ